MSFAAAELETFLRAVDRQLTSVARVEIIGGGAAALAYGVVSATEDIDTYGRVSAALKEAAARASAESGLQIPLRQSTVADLPHDFEARLLRVLPDLAKLEVWVVEKHDLALSKAVRCDEHDLQQLAELHAAVALDFETLVQRFKDEMSQAIGDPVRHRSRFLDLIERLFGELERATAEKRLPVPGK